MQDRFKFRLWDKEKKFMITEDKYDETYKIYGDEEVYYCLEYGLTDPFCCYENFIVMQSTSLKDKNCKLIYEGDIVKIHNNVTAKIIFDKGCFSFTDGVYNQACYWKKDTLEVIGNIYENPELLESN
jgi:uncharacterized phage protein (TIGR01671 family)